jgi:hypothetical protein
VTGAHGVVLALIAEGGSNGAILAELFPKTAGHT